jgi:hypothetical protein
MTNFAPIYVIEDDSGSAREDQQQHVESADTLQLEETSENARLVVGVESEAKTSSCEFFCERTIGTTGFFATILCWCCFMKEMRETYNTRTWCGLWCPV